MNIFRPGHIRTDIDETYFCNSKGLQQAESFLTQ